VSVIARQSVSDLTGELVSISTSPTINYEVLLVYPRCLFAPSSMPNSAPSLNPSNAPSSIPSTVLSIMPTSTPSSVPSVILSAVPSSLPSDYLCEPNEYEGQTLFAPLSSQFGEWCIRIQLFEGGTVFADTNNPNCDNVDFSAHAHYSDFSSFSENKAIFVGGPNSLGYDGFFAFKEDPSVTEPTLNLLSINAQTFEFDLLFGACTRAPSYMPSLLPSNSPETSYTQCPINQYEGQTYYSSYQDAQKTACYRLQLFNGGTVAINLADPFCDNTSNYQVSATLSNYAGIEGEVASFTPAEREWTGIVRATLDPDVTEPTATFFLVDNPNKYFITHLKVPSCVPL